MPFTQYELEEAYKQMQEERKHESVMALKAAKILTKLLATKGYKLSARIPGWDARWHGFNSASPYPCDYELYMELCQYDNWQHAIQTLGQHCQMQPWNGKGKVEGLFDVSNEPDFANERQKVFNITIDYYDSHVGGW